MIKLTTTHEELLKAIADNFFNNSEMPNRKVFRAEHSERINDLNFLEKAQVLLTDGDRYKISLKFLKSQLIWQKEKRITNKILKNLKVLYKNDPLAEFPIEKIIPKDEYALQPSGIKRALYYLREVGLIAGSRQDSSGSYIAISPHENVLLYDDIDAKIDESDDSAHTSLPLTEV